MYSRSFYLIEIRTKIKLPATAGIFIVIHNFQKFRKFNGIGNYVFIKFLPVFIAL